MDKDYISNDIVTLIVREINQKIDHIFWGIIQKYFIGLYYIWS